MTMPYFAMYTEDGNRAVQHMFDTLRERFKADVKLLGELHDDLAAHRPGYTDTAVRECIGTALADLLYEAAEYFGEALRIEGTAFQKYFARHLVDKQGGFAAMLSEYHGVQ